MALTTVFSVAKRANILVQVVDENVGTGTGSEKDFDLDKDNIITGTLVLSHAPASGDTNAFTTLTETTDYTVDLPSGKISLTTAGLTEVGTDVIYASYYHLARLTEATINGYITAAEKRLEAMTGRCFEATTKIDKLDGVSRSFYPRTDHPFEVDKPEWDYVDLNHWPVRSVSEVWFLDRSQGSYTEVHSDDGGTFTDNTTEANTVSGTAFNVFAATPAVNDAIYFGHPNKVLGIQTKLQTLGTDAGSLAVTWEYYNGSTWASLSNVTAGTTGADTFEAEGKVTWDMPSAWAKTTVNSGQSLYFVRARLSAGSYTIAPALWECYADLDSIISLELSLRDIDYTRYGRVTFLRNLIRDGPRNIRIKYVCAVETTDPEYELGVDLANLLGALMCAVAITGGSFDDETSFTLGAWSSTVGEVYVNVREFVNQLKEEIASLKNDIGARQDVV